MVLGTTERPAHLALPEEEHGRNVYDVLVERGFVAQVSDEAGLRAALERQVTVYCGYDPTATSLHIGNQLTLMMLAHFQRHGHRPIALLGGGTGMIGDPTDRASQRPLLTEGQIEATSRRCARSSRATSTSARRPGRPARCSWTTPTGC